MVGPSAVPIGQALLSTATTAENNIKYLSTIRRILSDRLDEKAASG